MDSNDNAMPPSREAPTGPRPTAKPTAPAAAEAAPCMLSATVETHGRARSDLLAFDLTDAEVCFSFAAAPHSAGEGRGPARAQHRAQGAPQSQRAPRGSPTYRTPPKP